MTSTLRVQAACTKMTVYFDVAGTLRKHVQEVCSVRKEFVEQDEYLDEEWEADLVARTGGNRDNRDKEKDKVSRRRKRTRLSAKRKNGANGV